MKKLASRRRERDSEDDLQLLLLALLKKAKRLDFDEVDAMCAFDWGFGQEP